MVSALRGGLLRPDEILIVAHGPVGPAGLECGHRYARRPPKPAPPSTRGSPGRKRLAWTRLPLPGHYRAPRSKWRRPFAAVARPTAVASSASLAPRTPRTEPKTESSLRRFAGPMPETSSSSERIVRLLRACRWKPMAKRRASSRSRWTSCSTGERRGSAMGPARPRPQISPSPLAPAHHLAHGGEVVGGPGDPAYAELTVFRLLRGSLFEEDHGRHDVGSLDVGDVEALDSARLHLQVEQIPERAEDLLGLRARMLPLHLEGETRVADDEVEQPELLPPLRDADAHVRPPPRGEPGLQQLPVRDLRRHEHLAGHVAPGGVELLDGRGEDGLRLREAVEEEALACHDLAIAHGEDLDRRPSALDLGREEVALLEVRGRDLLRHLQALEGADLVAQARRLLEALAGRRSLHRRPQAVYHFLRASLEEEPRVFAGATVPIERADLGHAGREAALDLVLQAGPRPPAVQGLLAGTDSEEIADEAGRLAPQAGGDVRPSVDVAVFGRTAHDVQPGVLLGERQLEVGVVLVVAEAGVVARLVALDEVVLEGKRLHLAFRDDEVEVGNLPDHGRLGGVEGARGLEVRAQD